jgi:phenylacetate-CoA ligase
VSEPHAVQRLRELVAQLDRSQWASAAAVASSQFDHLGRLAVHCNQQSSYFASRLKRAGLAPGELATPAGLSKLAVLTRREVQRAGEALYCAAVPNGHGDVHETRTSGSTGEPVVIRRTAVTRLFWNALSMRDHHWHGRTLSGRLCAITPRVTTPTEYPDWGAPAALLTTTGRSLALPIVADIARLVAWLQEFAPSVLVARPATLAGIAEFCARHRVELPDLRHVISLGEVLSSVVRTVVEQTFEVPLADCYSSEEFGHLAIQCPESGAYHVMSESVLAEVLDERGEACGPGQVGRVTLTALHNYATPLIRYAIGDYAEVGTACPCGRGLQTWRRILGRERNLMTKPDGTRHWPMNGFHTCREVAPISQYQIVQEGREAFEARLVVERALTGAEEDALRALFQSWVGYPFRLRFTYFSDCIPVGVSGKLEDFVSLVSFAGLPERDLPTTGTAPYNPAVPYRR